MAAASGGVTRFFEFGEEDGFRLNGDIEGAAATKEGMREGVEGSRNSASTERTSIAREIDIRSCVGRRR